MVIQQRTVIDKTEIAADGTIFIRFLLQTVKDGDVIAQTHHRTSVAPGADVDAVIAAVNADISTRPTLRAAAVETAGIPQIKAIAAVVHTADVVKAYNDKEAAEQERLKTHGAIEMGRP